MSRSDCRFQFTADEWAQVAAILGNLDGVEYVDLGDDGFELVGLFDPDLIEEFRDSIRPATLDVVKTHIESRLAQARAAVSASSVVRAIGEKDKKIAVAARQLLDLLPDIDPADQGLPRPAIRSARFRAQLQEIAEVSEAQGDEIAAWFRRPAARPPVPEYRVEFWTYLMKLWTDALHRPPTNSPGGTIARFIDAASAPARDILEPSQGKAFEFVRQHRRSVW
ncbi:hypothetical protein [Bosea sp. BK604]|uniref:hypothetical protein n=1 Tax=Bosea sp. BK604 TaxID=2512180 RepID=UPI001053869B|nr:hypothetical protein [Bosea sp. BK604]TCR60959.1 hypothetical protein EV560_115184 [Bosea sp. BK604]